MRSRHAVAPARLVLPCLLLLGAVLLPRDARAAASTTRNILQQTAAVQDSLGAINRSPAHCITTGTNFSAGLATLTSGGSVAKMTWGASVSGVQVNVDLWDGAAAFLLQVWNHPYPVVYPDSVIIDSVKIAPYTEGKKLYYADADSVAANPPGTGQGNLYLQVQVK